jgi:hypothetical protein
MKKVLTIAVIAITVGACAHIQSLNPQLRGDWNRTLYFARSDVDSGNYFAAQKVLDEFARTHPGTQEAKEVEFWKAAYLVDPANERGSLDGGIAALDSYLASDSAGWYRNEATLLRRTAAVAQGIATQPRSAPSDSVSVITVKDTVVVGSKSRDEQIAALKDQLARSRDELAKVSAELDRIKKRLANPSN